MPVIRTAFAHNNSSSSGEACLDTGSTHTLLRLSDSTGLQDAPTHSSITVRLPNSTEISSMTTKFLILPHLPHKILAHIFPDKMLDTSLISISNLCNMGCEATFTQNTCQVTYRNNIVLSTAKLISDNLWHIPLPVSHPVANTTILLTSDKNFVAFAHAALGSPSISTFIRAVKLGYLIHWPRLTVDIINNHLPHTLSTAQGHLNQQRQGVDSTKTPSTVDDSHLDQPFLPSTPAEANHVYVRMQRLPHRLSSDLTGRFPVPSITGSQYVLVTEFDGYIHVESMNSRSHNSRNNIVTPVTQRIPFCNWGRLCIVDDF